MKHTRALNLGLTGLTVSATFWLFPGLLGLLHAFDLHHIEDIFSNKGALKAIAVLSVLLIAHGWRQRYLFHPR